MKRALPVLLLALAACGGSKSDPIATPNANEEIVIVKVDGLS